MTTSAAERQRIEIKATLNLVLFTEVPNCITKLLYGTMQGHINLVSRYLPDTKSAGNVFINTVRSIYASRQDIDFDPDFARTLIEKAYAKYKRSVLELMRDTAEATEGEITKKALTIDPRYIKEADERQRVVQRDGIFFGKAPLVVISKPPLSFDKLKQKEFHVSKLHDYLVLEDQLLLGVQHVTLSDEEIDEVSKRVRKVTARAKDHSKDPAKASAEMQKYKGKVQAEAELAALNSVQGIYSSLRLTPILTGNASPLHDSGANWFWMLPSKHYQLLKRCTITTGEVSGLNLSNWNFASNYGGN